MAFRFWQEMASPDFPGLDPAQTVAVLPLAATEQHGPHLATGTDAFIAQGLLSEVADRFDADFDLVVLPVLPVGASLEHSRFAGTLSLAATSMIEQISELGAQVAASGIRKLIIISSHGGNIAAMTAAALECRTRHDLFVVTSTWLRLGMPPDVVEERERAVGVHGGFVETSLMLHLNPELVRMEKAEAFHSLQTDMTDKYDHLRAYGPVGFGWLSGDLNRVGATGDAGAASAAAGAAICSHQAQAFIALAGEVSEIDLATTFGE